jgi:hypothetical protein
MYHTYCKPKTRVMTVRDIFDFFSKHKNKLSENAQKEVEKKVYDLIAGTPPGVD